MSLSHKVERLEVRQDLPNNTKKMRVMENVSFYSPPMLDFIAALKSTLCLIWKNIPIKKTLVAFSFQVSVLIVNSVELCWGLFSSR